MTYSGEVGRYSGEVGRYSGEVGRQVFQRSIKGEEACR